MNPAPLAGQLSTVLTVAGVGGIFLLRLTTPGKAFVVSKALASTGFVLVALTGHPQASTYGTTVLLALILCWAGDLFLGLDKFLPGLASFLLAHLALIAAFALHGLDWTRALWAVPILIAVTAAILRWLLPRIPATDRAPVLAYIAVINAMVFFAAGASTGPAGALILIGAVLFYFSDVFVARARFVKDDFLNDVGCYPLYYSACLLLAWSLHAYHQGIEP